MTLADLLARQAAQDREIGALCARLDALPDWPEWDNDRERLRGELRAARMAMAVIDARVRYLDALAACGAGGRG